MKLSVVLIVKNEEACLEKCLDSVVRADEIIICDTGSTDNTIEIAKRYTDKIVHFKWCDDFSAARNYAKSFATGNWIFSIDADHILETSLQALKESLIKADKEYEQAALVEAKGSHFMAVCFKNIPEIYWVGKCHECLNISTSYITCASMIINKSPTHLTDPDRNLRILNSISNPTQRDMFYLGREYYERGMWGKAISYMLKYIDTNPTYLAEKAEALYILAYCYWKINEGYRARPYCMQALEININFKRAVLLMAEMSWPHNSKTWKEISKLCTNEKVLFI